MTRPEIEAARAEVRAAARKVSLRDLVEIVVAEQLAAKGGE